MAKKYVKWINAPIWVKIGRNVMHTRQWKNMTQEQTAKRAGIDLKTFRKIEKGQVRDLTVEQAYRIVMALRCEVELVVPMINRTFLKPKHILG